jgi:putative ABC transport system substrate-binding protein
VGFEHCVRLSLGLEGDEMRRREFITLVGGAVAGRPLTAHAQQKRVHQIGVLTPFSENDPGATSFLAALVQSLAHLGWTEGSNLRMHVRWAAGSLEQARRYAKELVGLQPDVILVDSTPQTAALQQETLTIPIIFVEVSDPVGSRFVASLSHPGGNITGFGNHEPSLAGRWLEMLVELAPNVRRVAAIFNSDTAPYVQSYYLPVFETAARTNKVEPITAIVRSAADIEAVMAQLGDEPNGGFVVMPDAFTFLHRGLIMALAARGKIPGMYTLALIVREGGLIAYCPDIPDLYRRAAAYIDRTLRGAKPADLPVQMPVKFQTVVNAKTAKAIGLAIPPSVLVAADEVIE